MKRKLNHIIAIQAMAGFLAFIMLGIGSPAIAAELPIRTKTLQAATPQYTSPTTTSALASAAPVLQRCKGPDKGIAPKETFILTCNVTSTLGGNKMMILPEVWISGNGCITTVDKPRVVMVGNNFGVTATFTNRCGGGYSGTEGGLSWLIYQTQ